MPMASGRPRPRRPDRLPARATAARATLADRLNTGSDAEATVWTDDLTHEYVHINADYES